MKRRDPRAALESAVQAAIVELLCLAQHPRLIWFQQSNGWNVSQIERARQKRLGMRLGVADLCFVLPDGRAAFLEVKRPGGRQSPEQRTFQIQCEVVGAPYAVVRSSAEAEDVLRAWGALKGSVREGASWRGNGASRDGSEPRRAPGSEPGLRMTSAGSAERSPCGA